MEPPPLPIGDSSGGRKAVDYFFKRTACWIIINALAMGYYWWIGSYLNHEEHIDPELRLNLYLSEQFCFQIALLPIALILNVLTLLGVAIHQLNKGLKRYIIYSIITFIIIGAAWIYIILEEIVYRCTVVQPTVTPSTLREHFARGSFFYEEDRNGRRHYFAQSSGNYDFGSSFNDDRSRQWKRDHSTR